MSAQKHTPGPWQFDGPHAVVGAETECFSIFSKNSIGMVIFMPGEDDREQCRADARLMAASPDLLSALEFISKWELMRANGTDGFKSPLPAQLSNAIRKAITKAKGE